MAKPLVSIIVLSYNHERYISEAIDSAINQDYSPIEIIAIDDSSADQSGKILKNLSDKYHFTFIQNEHNMGNCKAFNKALKLSKGKYIIDLAGDDILLDQRVKRGVEDLQKRDNTFGVSFCDVALTDEKGKSLSTHYRRKSNGDLQEHIPQGWIFKDLLERYFISPPSMLIKREVLEELNGYDESLTYEDFDFWIRSSRKYQYSFTDQILVQKRVLKKSLSTQQKKLFNKHIKSTYQVCEKALELCHTKEEKRALKKRIKYELKWALFTANFNISLHYLRLIKRL